ncbi:hypothetical protein GE09DRAFT_1118883 [Coniochaeta sp. 2T2.1]|nr:hypothetical protein GE09DRAFT_1118883 [Coniochaeta sp. 2T2.1]
MKPVLVYLQSVQILQTGLSRQGKRVGVPCRRDGSRFLVSLLTLSLEAVVFTRADEIVSPVCSVVVAVSSRHLCLLDPLSCLAIISTPTWSNSKVQLLQLKICGLLRQFIGNKDLLSLSTRTVTGIISGPQYAHRPQLDRSDYEDSSLRTRTSSPVCPCPPSSWGGCPPKLSSASSLAPIASRRSLQQTCI